MSHGRETIFLSILWKKILAGKIKIKILILIKIKILIFIKIKILIFI